jgi:YD repeat-containing protein
LESVCAGNSTEGSNPSLSATADVVASITDPGNRSTAFTYDLRGRRTHVDAPDTLDASGAPLTNITQTLYFPDGNVQETTGAQTYRTTHTYDYADRQKTLTTYGTTTATTTWTYSPTRGYLTRKEYHDGKGTDYTYTKAGRLQSRHPRPRYRNHRLRPRRHTRSRIHPRHRPLP